jgi:hypothetical protein
MNRESPGFSRGEYQRLPDPEERQRVVLLLKTMAERAWMILRTHQSESSFEQVFRANVYLTQKDKLRIWCQWNMDDAPDADLVFDLGCGLTGFCHARRRPLICNLQTIDDQHARGEPDAIHYFGLAETQQVTITKAKRTWLASFPIFDPGDIGLHEAPTRPLPVERDYFVEVASPIAAGGVFGVLNLDANFNLEEIGLHPEPAHTLTDPRVASIIALMQSTTFEVGQILSAGYPNTVKRRG